MSFRAILFLLHFMLAMHSASPASAAQAVPDSVDRSVIEDSSAAGHAIAGSPQPAAQDSGSWFGRHPAETGLIGAIVGAALTLLGGWYLTRRTEKRAPEVAKKTELAKIEVAQEIEIKTHDEIESRYLKGVISEHGSIKLYGFQSRVNLDVRTLDVFVSLRLTAEPRADPLGELDAHADGRHLSPEEVLQRALGKKRLLLVIGDPGSGKTTLLKYFAICCVDEKGRQRLRLQRPLLPILLPLRKVDPQLPFCTALSEWATLRNRPVTAELFDQWLERRGALVLLDGLDEISDLAKRKAVCEWIDNAAQYYGNSQFVVTSRYTGYRAAEGVELRADHLRAEVLDLDNHQQELFLKNWFAAIYGRESEDADLAPEARQREAAAQAQDLADGVRRYLNRPESESLRRMAGTPMLLQIMAILWKEFHNLPPARATLYEKCLDYLLDYRDSDREKEITPLLPADDAKIVLRPLCLWMQETHGNDEVTLKDIAAHISPALEEVKPGTKPADFIKNLCDRAGILQEFGDQGYLFRHKSFREYFAATQLAEEVKSKPERANVLVENFHAGWWRETILFCLSLPKPVIFADFFARFLPHANNTPNALPLLELAIKEARQKSTVPFADFVLEMQQDWQKRYNALHCLRLIASEPAKQLVQAAWQQEKKDMRVKQLAEEILIEWKLRRPETVPAPAVQAPKRGTSPSPQIASVETAYGFLPSWRNPIELNAEYILIPGGKFVFSVNKEQTEVPELYFAKYPVTNKLYRRFIQYLAGQSAEEIARSLPVERFTSKLLAAVKGIASFVDFLGDPNKWQDKLRSRFDSDKRFNAEDQPVVGVSWFAAVAYCHWLSEMQRANGKQQEETPAFRLPTEAEWEWAAGGGKREYPWDDAVPDETCANFDHKVGHTTPVGSYPAGATPEGLMDMAGNVWEWMENFYSEKKDARALRGGAWFDDGTDNLRCAARFDYLPSNDWVFSGFRVVRAQSAFDTLKL